MGGGGGASNPPALLVSTGLFKETCLKPRNATFTPPKRITFFTVYELHTWSLYVNSDFTLKYCLFGGVKLAKNAYLNKYLYRGYDTAFDSRLELSLPDGSVVKLSLFLELI